MAVRCSFSTSELSVPLLVELQVFVWHWGLDLLEGTHEVLKRNRANFVRSDLEIMSFKEIQWGEGLKTQHLNSEYIQNPKVLKVQLEMVRLKLWSRPLEKWNYYIRIQDGSQLFGFQMAFKIQTIHNWTALDHSNTKHFRYLSLYYTLLDFGRLHRFFQTEGAKNFLKPSKISLKITKISKILQ